MKTAVTLSHDKHHSITTNKQNLSSGTTSVTIHDLRPRSICMLFLLAVYNPASIDSGIAIIGSTLDAREVQSG